MKKKCSNCKEEKPLKDFYKHNGNGHNIQPYCKSCSRDYLRQYRRLKIGLTT